MNRRMIVYTLSKMISMEGILLLLPAITGFIYQESAAFVYLIMAIALFALGSLASYKKPKQQRIYAREGFITCALAWLIVSMLGAIPFVITGEIPHYVDAFFETVSGFTTTGASILNDIEALSHASLFWRSFSHWVGGMGILVFVLAFLPGSDGRTLHIMKAEVPGPVVGKLVSKVSVTARILYMIYAVMTAIEVVLLLLGGMPLFDSLLNSFGTAGTGGFAILNAGIGGYQSAYVDYVISIFMLLFGINFNLFYFICLGKVKDALHSEELKWYLGIVFGAVMIIAVNIQYLYGSFLEAFRYSLFQVSSIITTTGYTTADYGAWPMLSQLVLLTLMFVGAMAGSTGGGIKVSRIAILIKSSFQACKKVLHPNYVETTEFENKYVDDGTIMNIHRYIGLYIIIFTASLFIIALENIDFMSCFSAVSACFNNIGPGFNVVGPVSNFFSLSDLSKVVLSFDMLAGRLEILPMLLIFLPSTWRK